MPGMILYIMCTVVQGKKSTKDWGDVDMHSMLGFSIFRSKPCIMTESPPPSLVHAVTHHVSLKAYEALILSKQWSM